MFNTESRTKNTLRVTTVSEFCTIINQLMGFIYRTVFIHILSAEYLGLNGLFTNLLSLLSLADLGIASAIVYRFYDPISRGDHIKVGKIMNFFKQVYHFIIVIVFAAGILLLPCIDFFVNNKSDIPDDVNIYNIYILFLIQTASSYMYAYKQTLLTADQKQYKVSIFQTGLAFSRYVIQILLLFIFRNYQLTLAISIFLTISGNYLFSFYVTRTYKEVFLIKQSLDKVERKEIFKDTRACLCHRVGACVLSSTDNLILSKMVGLLYVGIYSNYYLIINSLNNLANQMLSNATASIGNAHACLEKNERYRIYEKMEFVNLWVVSSLTACLYPLLNPFMKIWMGDKLIFDKLTVIILCLQFYFEMSRQINISFTNASGLFTKDIWRPIVEALINLIVSIILVKAIGIAGVFLGTIVSCLATVFWREPYLLYKYEFEKSMRSYWIKYVLFFGITFLYAMVFDLFIAIRSTSLLEWMLNGLLCFGGIEVVLFVIFHRSREFAYLSELAQKFSSGIKKRIWNR